MGWIRPPLGKIRPPPVQRVAESALPLKLSSATLEHGLTGLKQYSSDKTSPISSNYFYFKHKELKLHQSESVLTQGSTSKTFKTMKTATILDFCNSYSQSDTRSQILRAEEDHLPAGPSARVQKCKV